MANRAKYTAQSFGIGREYMEFQLKLNGSAAPTVTEGAEIVASVTHAGGGNIVVVTLKDSFPKVVAHAVDIRDDSANGSYATIGTITGENSATVPTAPIKFNINTWQASGAAANDSSLVVVVTLALRNSNVTAGN